MIINNIIQDIQEVSFKTVALFGLAIFSLHFVSQWVTTERNIRAMGGHAPKIRSNLPFSLDIIAKIVSAIIHHTTLELWQDLFSAWGRGGNTIEITLAGARNVLTTDPENIKATLATQFQDFGKGKNFSRDFHDFLGDSVFTTDLQQWHDSRQLIRPMFLKDRVSDLHVFERHVQILIKMLGPEHIPGSTTTKRTRRGKEINLSDLFLRYTLDITTDFLLGSSSGSLEAPNQEYAQAFTEAQRVQSLIVRAGPPLNIFIPRKSFNASIKIINAFVNPFIDQVLNLSPEELASKAKSDLEYTFLHALAGFTRDRRVIRDQIVSILLAGRDTTASTLNWTFYELAQHPEVLKKLRDEILATVGLERAPTFEDLKNMKYLQNTLKETLRIYPAVPFNIRVALRDTSLPRGGGPDGQSPIGILKGTTIGYSPLVMQRRADLYPSEWCHAANSPLDPLCYNPDRWMEWQPKAWTYIPFNGGPRICLGQQFALTEIAYTIVRILQRFEGVVPKGEKGDTMGRRMGPNWDGKPVLHADISLQPAMGIWVEFVEMMEKN